MKIILTGSTGFIGQEILSQCLAHPSITSIVALSRRDLPISNAKLTVKRIAEPDFASSFSTPELKSAIRGADACIWTLGVTPSLTGSDWETLRRVSLDYTRAAAEAFSDLYKEEAKESSEAKRFRFVYFSGALAERDQERPLWLSEGYRKVRVGTSLFLSSFFSLSRPFSLICMQGEAENILLDHAKENDDCFESYILRPGMVLKGGTVRSFIRGLVPSVRVEVLAKSAVDVAVYGHGERLLENDVLTAWK